MTGLDIWELAALPYLLNNSETWTETSKKTFESLDNLQNMFYRNLLATPRSCPIPSLLWETGGILMEFRVAQKKLLFYHHLTHLPESSLAHEIAVIQTTLSYPGLMLECQEMIEEYNLPDAKPLSKIQWKKIVKKKILELNQNCLLETVKTKYKKLDYNVLIDEKFEMKEYLKSLNLPDARIKFGIRSKMTKSVQMNFKGDPSFAQNHWKCQHCFTPDTQEHILRCPCYQHLRTGKDMNSDKVLVDYFRKVIKLREKFDDEKRN